MENKTRSLADQYVSNIHSLFAAKADFSTFSRMVDSLDQESKGNFIRACSLFKKTMKLRDAEPDISIALLCSAVESIQPRSSIFIFKDWLKANKLEDLEGKTKKEIRLILDASFEDYISSESEREGALYHFKRFLLENCPGELRRPPMSLYPKYKLPARQASFDESLGFIYSRFRSLFIHEGVPRLEVTQVDGNLVGRHLLDIYRKDAFNIDMMKVLDWFSQVVGESLWHWLASHPAHVVI